MKNFSLAFFLAITLFAKMFGQTTLANFDFNGGSGYPISALSTASNVNASISGTEANAAYNGVASGSQAFVQNNTAGSSISMANSSGTNTKFWTLTLSGSALTSYQSYKLYFQSQRSNTGATSISIYYSTDGSNYTLLGQTATPGNQSYAESTIDLSSITTINGSATIYIKLAASGASGSGTLRIDNLQVQASTSGGSGSNPWVSSGDDISFNGGAVNIGGNVVPGTNKLTVAGNSSFGNDVNVSGSVNATQYRLNGSPIAVLSGTNNTIAGDLTISNNLNVANQMSLGNNGSSQKMTVSFAESSPSTPAILKFSGTGIGLIGNPPGGGTDGNPNPNLECVNGLGLVNAFAQALSVAYYPTGPNSPTGGNILMGHNGTNAFIETQGTGSAPNNPPNHPGDLFINKTCSRNVYFFDHLNPFGSALTNIVSIGGSLNVRKNMQVGDNVATNFTDNLSKIYVSSNVGSSSNGIKIKHGANGMDGIRIATYNNAIALEVTQSPNLANDGGTTFKIEGDGRTAITTTNTTAFTITDGTNGNVNFKVNKSGETFSRHIRVMVANFPDYVFEPDYKLMSLREIETYYKKHKHLPEIPSAAEVEQDNLDLGEMNKLLLKKVEELTILMVQQQNEIDLLKSKVK